jgi:hypothetical protein
MFRSVTMTSGCAAAGLLFDLGLGRLAGHRFLQLTHRGRSSGRIHRTVLEVWQGDRADWYRNIRATPALQVGVAGEKYVPVQRFLDSREFYARLQTYVKRNWLTRGLVRRTLGLRLDGTDEDRANLDQRGYRGVAFRPMI